MGSTLFWHRPPSDKKEANIEWELKVKFNNNHTYSIGKADDWDNFFSTTGWGTATAPCQVLVQSPK
jgi:hypothetical protein